MAGKKYWISTLTLDHKNLASRDKYGLKISYSILLFCYYYAPYEGAHGSVGTALLIPTFCIIGTIVRLKSRLLVIFTWKSFIIT